MKKLFEEFKKFINKGNALSLAIGVILGAAFTSIVTTINTKIISPLIGLLLGDADLSNSLVTVLKSTVRLPILPSGNEFIQSVRGCCIIRSIS